MGRVPSLYKGPYRQWVGYSDPWKVSVSKSDAWVGLYPGGLQRSKGREDSVGASEAWDGPQRGSEAYDGLQGSGGWDKPTGGFTGDPMGNPMPID
jgi:hypothetical protein